MFKYMSIKKLLHWYQYDMNYPLYWWLRLKVQQMGGVKRIFAMLYLRRIESKRNSTTGIGKKGNCCIIQSPIIMPHGMICVVIGRNVIIGKNVAINQHVTIAEADKSKTTVIEDDVMIGAGAVILNNAHIGKGAKIGANAVVLHDVPAHATAVGNPARIILKRK